MYISSKEILVNHFSQSRRVIFVNQDLQRISLLQVYFCCYLHLTVLRFPIAALIKQFAIVDFVEEHCSKVDR